MSQEPSSSEPSPAPPSDEVESGLARFRRLLVGAPRNVHDKGVFHHLALIPFLAWVGLGSDGLSSSSYGPSEAFTAVGQHRFLAIFLALACALTVAIISSAYSRIIEQFPHGGGGYVVATKLLGSSAGVVSGSALLVDYVLTITTSIAAAGDALFSFMPPHWHSFKLGFEVVLILAMTVLNIRGLRESIIPLIPVFLLFLATHVILIVGGIVTHLADFPAVSHQITTEARSAVATLGWGGVLALFARAYSLGGGTYTGIEAVSNGLPIMREPRVQTGKRTMLYMALSLAFTAGGLLICYLLVGVSAEEGKTLNAVLVERLTQHLPGGHIFVIATLFAEGALLAVAAQAGFIDGPRVLANMALDNWMPRRFSALSERLTTQNGIVLMSLASIAALLYTGGEVSHLVVMYSINVFLTFSLSMAGMLRSSVMQRKTQSRPLRTIAIFLIGLLLCVTVLVVTIIEKFAYGGWVTIAVTLALVSLCFAVRSHYSSVAKKVGEIDRILLNLHGLHSQKPLPALDLKQPTAVVLVSAYNGIGVHTVLNLINSFGSYFKNIAFVSAATIDSGAFKGEEEMHAMENSTAESLQKYVDLVNRLGIPAFYRFEVGTDPIDDLERLCKRVTEECKVTLFVAGQLIFQRESWYHGLLHNQTAYSMQKRLQWDGKTMIILPVRIR